MAEYTPSDEDMREKYLWAHAREAEGVAEQSYALQVCGEVWDAWLAAHDARVRRDAVRQFIEACKEKRDEPGFLLPANHWEDIDAAIRVAESYVKNYPEETPDAD